MNQWIGTLNLLTPPLLRMLPPMIASIVRYFEIRRCHCFPISLKQSIVYGLAQTLQYILHILYMETQGKAPVLFNFVFNWMGSFGSALIDGLPVAPCGFQQHLRNGCLKDTFGRERASSVLALTIQQQSPKLERNKMVSVSKSHRRAPQLSHKTLLDQLGVFYIVLSDEFSLSTTKLTEAVQAKSSSMSHSHSNSRSHSRTLSSTSFESEKSDKINFIPATLTLDAAWHPIQCTSAIDADEMYQSKDLRQYLD